jgi:hypothetical protein
MAGDECAFTEQVRTATGGRGFMGVNRLGVCGFGFFDARGERGRVEDSQLG